jgi:hypothetical protein
MAKKTRSGFWNDAADKIWSDHLGNNVFVEHRDQCRVCLEVYRARCSGVPWWSEGTKMCNDGERIFDAMLEEIDQKLDEVQQNQN